jgi:DNA-binding MarR family transcriptional regulator
MEIGSELNQAKFRNEYHKVTVNLVFTYSWLTKKLNDFFQPYGITPLQFNILRILRGNKGPLSTVDIHSRMIDRTNDTSRMVDRLINKNLVVKSTNKVDKRMVDITIAERGLALLSTIDKREQELDNIAANLTLQQGKTLNYLLDKLRGWDDDNTVF